MFYRHGLICDLWFKVMHLSCDSGGQEKAPGELDSLLSTLNTLTAIHFMISEFFKFNSSKQNNSTNIISSL